MTDNSEELLWSEVGDINNNMRIPQGFLSLNSTLIYLDISVEELRKLRKTGVLKSYRGKCTYYKLQDLEDYLNSKQQQQL